MSSVVFPSPEPMIRIWLLPIVFTSAIDGSPTAMRAIPGTVITFCVPTPRLMLLPSCACAADGITTANARSRSAEPRPRSFPISVIPSPCKVRQRILPPHRPESPCRNCDAVRDVAGLGDLDVRLHQPDPLAPALQ